MRFSEMNQKQLREARNELQGRLKHVFGSSVKAQSLTDNNVHFVGGHLPASYDANEVSLIVWGRASRCSGASMTVDELLEAESIVYEFYHDHLVGL